MVVVWSAPNTEKIRSDASLDRGFQDVFGKFVIEHLSRVCFEVPSKNSFNSNDAQSRLVEFLNFASDTSGFGRNSRTTKIDLRNERRVSNLIPRN